VCSPAWEHRTFLLTGHHDLIPACIVPGLSSRGCPGHQGPPRPPAAGPRLLPRADLNMGRRTGAGLLPLPLGPPPLPPPARPLPLPLAPRPRRCHCRRVLLFPCGRDFWRWFFQRRGTHLPRHPPHRQFQGRPAGLRGGPGTPSGVPNDSETENAAVTAALPQGEAAPAEVAMIRGAFSMLHSPPPSPFASCA